MRHEVVVADLRRSRPRTRRTTTKTIVILRTPALTRRRYKEGLGSVTRKKKDMMMVIFVQPHMHTTRAHMQTYTRFSTISLLLSLPPLLARSFVRSFVPFHSLSTFRLLASASLGESSWPWVELRCVALRCERGAVEKEKTTATGEGRAHEEWKKRKREI